MTPTMKLISAEQFCLDVEKMQCMMYVELGIKPNATLATDAVLKALGADPQWFPQVHPGVRQVGPQVCRIA